MLDPLTAMGVAGNVVQFVDFACTVVSKTRKIYRTGVGLSEDHLTLKIIGEDLVHISQRLGQPLAPLSSPSNQLSDAEEALEKINKACAEEADKLLVALNRLKRTGSDKYWNSFKAALRTIWNQDEIDGMVKRLENFRNALDTHILIALREDINLAKMKQSEEFRKLNENIQCVVDVLMHNQKAFMDTVQHQMSSFAQMQTRTNLLISAEKKGAAEPRKQRKEREEEEAKNAKTIKLQADRDARRSPEEILQAVKKESVEQRRDARRLLAKSILKTLSFETMTDRRQDIHDAHQETFEWIYHNPQSDTDPFYNFTSWLETGTGIYWVNGKAGSGKSTLLKYLCDDPRTQQALELWSPNTVVASFFFWKAAHDPLQRTQIGLLRAVLHEILSRAQHLIPLVFPQQWHAWDSQKDAFTWKFSQLKHAFQVAISAAMAQTRVCLFIDGLDEYSGNHGDIVDLIVGSVSESVKFCVSSRPLNVFEHAFGKYPGLQLQYLTSQDITNYVHNKLGKHDRMRELQTMDPLRVLRILEEVVKKAAGVFLWVELVVARLLDSLTNWDTIAMLEERVEHFPPELDDLYMHMLKGIDPFYKYQASEILQIFDAADDGLKAIELSYALEADPDTSIKTAIQVPTRSEQLRRCKEVDRWLRSRCLGLLELRVRLHYSILKDSRCDDDQLISSKVEYLHRTVTDFLKRPNIWTVICADAKPLFDPHISLLRARLMAFKATPPFGYWDENGLRFWAFVWMCIGHARQAQSCHLAEQNVLLDELNRVATHHWRQMARNEDHIPVMWRYAVSWRTHWVSTSVPGVGSANTSGRWSSRDGVNSFIQYASKEGLETYAQEKLTKYLEKVVNKPLSISAIAPAELDQKSNKSTPRARLLQYMQANLESAARLRSQDPDQELLQVWFEVFTALVTPNGVDPKDTAATTVYDIFKPWYPSGVPGIKSHTRKKSSFTSWFKLSRGV
ncbi:hypothetical protein FB567DRAFT_576556 [Paraphoma chrysanthemicola]|uniref:NACHT domain-containing protein n=1 Tax=Paraphoma chrysanthemicola TaxID=798071 RepID=A0A8K0RG17_9PLEO|nr:hypothetical protein FB567DRAFT_576556 [Paraphoma chrysanthemicola]